MEIPLEELVEGAEVGVVFVGGASGRQGGSDNDVVITSRSRANLFSSCRFELELVELGDGEGTSSIDDGVSVLEWKDGVVIKLF